MDIALVNYFLSRVYQHYPVGFSHIISIYPGYLEMEKISADKTKKECKDPTSVSNLFAESIQKSFPLREVINVNNLYFPNYIVRICFPVAKEGKIVHESHFEICISLLCDYYTYFLVDNFRLDGFYEENPASSFTVLSCEQSQNRISETLPLIVENLHRYFPNKKYVSYNFLTSHFIYGATPFNDTPPEIYSMLIKYNFLDLLFTGNYSFGLPQKNLR